MCNCNQIPCTCIQTCGCLSQCTCEQNCEPCAEEQVCKINLDSSCVFYNLASANPSALTCVDLPNGTSLKVILETLDEKLCNLTPDINGYNLPCLRNSYVVTNFRQFSESVDSELCTIKTQLLTEIQNTQQDLSILSTLVTSIYQPNISTCGVINIISGDTIIDILQKFANTICNIQNNCCVDSSPLLQTANSNSVSFITSGSKNHNLTASVKISSQLGNLITVYPDGLYCSVTIPSSTQSLTYNSGTNVLTLSGGGGSVTLNPNTDNQTLSFNTLTKMLTILNGNTVDLSSLSSGSFTETPLVVVDSSTIDLSTSGTSGHILTANAKISTVPGNNLVDNSGLYVSSAADEKVKLNSSDPTSGNLESKVAGKINSLITTLVTSNNTSHQLEIESVLDIASLLNTISTNNTFLNLFCNIVKSCICYKFRLKNTDTSSITYDYKDCNGAIHSGLTLTSGSSVDFCGQSVTCSNNLVIIQNLGNC